jgi:hypothetical protein
MGYVVMAMCGNTVRGRVADVHNTKTHKHETPPETLPLRLPFEDGTAQHGCGPGLSVGHPVTVPRRRLRAVHGRDIRLSRRGTFDFIVEDCAGKD